MFRGYIKWVVENTILGASLSGPSRPPVHEQYAVCATDYTKRSFLDVRMQASRNPQLHWGATGIRSYLFSTFTTQIVPAFELRNFESSITKRAGFRSTILVTRFCLKSISAPERVPLPDIQLGTLQLKRRRAVGGTEWKGIYLTKDQRGHRTLHFGAGSLNSDVQLAIQRPRHRSKDVYQ